VPLDSSSNWKYDNSILVPPATNISPLTLNPVRAIPLKPLLPPPPLRAKVLRGRRFRQMVQVLEILLHPRIPPLSLVRGVFLSFLRQFCGEA
jgi:hypothetical protein